MLKQPRNQQQRKPAAKSYLDERLASKPAPAAYQPKQVNQYNVDDIFEFVETVNPEAARQFKRDYEAKTVKQTAFNYLGSFGAIYRFLYIMFTKSLPVRGRISSVIRASTPFYYFNEAWVKHVLDYDLKGLNREFKPMTPRDKIVASVNTGKLQCLYTPELFNEFAKMSGALNSCANYSKFIHELWINGKQLNMEVEAGRLPTKFMHVHKAEPFEPKGDLDKIMIY